MGKKDANKQTRSTWNTINDRFKSLDLFGTTVGFQIKGNDTFNTIPGAILSLFCYTIVLIYGGTKFIKM